MAEIKILALPLGNYNLASSRTRVYEILPRLKNKRIHSTICTGAGLGFRGRELEFILKAPFFDILFVQKSVSRRILFIVKLMKSIGKKIIYDLDDPSYMKWPEVDEFVKLADLVLVENEFNRVHCKKVNPKARVEILLGPINFAYYSKCLNFRKKSSLVTIGWIGSPNTSKNINLIANALERIGKKVGSKVRFVIIGGTTERVNHEFKNIQVEYRQWSLEKERKDLAEFDIGVMPIRDDTENRGKGGYKLLQYMAAGIPCVATAVGVNKKLIENERSGFLISTNNNEDEWFNALHRLVKNKSFRGKAGKMGRRLVKQYDIVPFCEKFENLVLELRA
ncbi:MAG: glycosyltransferase family 4 protein [Candidatus Diapherotrites archaeon]|nr:glycosyltransferase family 4 protein [Candidatus Diapherotrites archaeon]